MNKKKKDCKAGIQVILIDAYIYKTLAYSPKTSHKFKYFSFPNIDF